MWNPWHGCHKVSEGCAHCYVYRGDAKRGRDASVVEKNKNFDAPLARKKDGEYKIASGKTVYTCFSSDFFNAGADVWRPEAWDMIRQRPDLHFLMITKRIDRLAECIPEDWGAGWEHVTICCTVENQQMADYRLPVYKTAPVKHKIIICEPLLEKINLDPYIGGDWVEQIVAGGESGLQARPCNYGWVLELRRVCEERGIAFWFKQTGARLVKDGIMYNIPRRLQHVQARKAGINLDTPLRKSGL